MRQNASCRTIHANISTLFKRCCWLGVVHRTSKQLGIILLLLTSMLPIEGISFVGLQGSSPSGVQSEPLPTPHASPTAATPSFTPLTAQTASIAERSSLDAGAGQALFQPWALDSSSHPVTTAPGPATLASSLAPIPAALNVATDTQKGRPPLTVSPSTATTAGVSSAAGVTSPRARSSELKLNSRTQQAGGRSEAISSGSGAVPSRTASASTAIAAAARANAAAANAIAESGALANGSFPGASGQLPDPRMGEGFGNVVRSFTVPANNPPAHGASGPLSAAATASQKHLQGAGPNGYAGNSANGPLLSGAFATSRSGPLAAGQASAMSASQPASMAMMQQQRLNGTAFMTAMQQSAPASSIQGPFHGVAASTAPTAAALPNSSHNKSESGQQPAAYLGPGQKSQAFSNLNFRLPAGPASFMATLNPSPGGTSLPGSSVDPNFVSTSSTLNPGPPGNPAAPRQHYSASGLSNSSPNPIITKPAGPHVASGNPVSPSYQPQGLHAAALESGNQAISPAAPQVTALHSLNHLQSGHTLACSLTQHSLHSLTHPPASLTHSPTHSPTHPPTHSLIMHFTHSSYIHLSTHAFIQSLIHPAIDAFICSLVFLSSLPSVTHAIWFWSSFALLRHTTLSLLFFCFACYCSHAHASSASHLLPQHVTPNCPETEQLAKGANRPPNSCCYCPL